MEFHFQTELPPLSEITYSEIPQKRLITTPIKSIEAKKLRNDIGSKLNIAHQKNSESLRVKTSDVISTMRIFKPEIIQRQQLDLSLQEDIGVLKSSIEKINSDLFQTHIKADMCHIKLDPGISQKASQKIREINADITNFSKRIDANEAKFHKNEQKIKEKLERIRIALDGLVAIPTPNITKIFLKIDKVSTFLQNVQLSFILNMMKGNRSIQFQNLFLTNESIFMKFHDIIAAYRARMEVRIMDLKHQIQLQNTNLQFAKSSNDLLANRIKDALLKADQNGQNIDGIEGELERRLANIEKMLNDLVQSIDQSISNLQPNQSDQDSFRAFQEDARNRIRQLAKDWDLFHKNNNVVQKQVFDIIDQIDRHVTSDKSFLYRIELAERLVRYCVKRISSWRLEAERKMALFGGDTALIRKIGDLEQKVKMAEDRVGHIDGLKTEDMSFIPPTIAKFEMPIPPQPLPAKEELKPFYIPNDLILTYDQEKFKEGDNDINYGFDIDDFPYSKNPPEELEKPTNVELIDDPSLYHVEEEYDDDDDDDGDNSDEYIEDVKDKGPISTISSYNMFKLKRRKKRLTNRCYDPFVPLFKKGEKFKI